MTAPQAARVPSAGTGLPGAPPPDSPPAAGRTSCEGARPLPDASGPRRPGEGDSGPLATCRNCSGPLVKRRTRFGLCDACFQRWHKAGRPDRVPEPQRGGNHAAIGLDRARAARAANRARRKAAVMAVVAQTLADGLPVKAAARRARIANSTAWKYARELKQEATCS